MTPALLLRIYYEDTDFPGFVYHARYLHFFERGRTDAAFRHLGMAAPTRPPAQFGLFEGEEE